MLGVLKQIYEIFDKKQKILFLFVFIVGFIGSLFELLGVSVLVPLMGLILSIDQIVENVYVMRFMSAMHIKTSEQLLLIMIIVVIIVYILKNMYIIFQNYFTLRTVNNIQKNMESKLLYFYLRQPYLYHTKTSPSEIERTIINDLPNVFTAVSEIFLILSDVITSVFLTAFLLYTSTVITVAVVILLALFVFLYVKVFRERLTYYGEKARVAGGFVFLTLSQALRGIKEVKVYEKEEHFAHEFYEWRSKQMALNKRTNFFGMMPRNLLEAICVTGVLGVIILKLQLGADKSTLVVQLSVFAVAAYKLLPTANRLTAEITSLYSRKASIEAINSDICKDKIQLNDIESKKAKRKKDKHVFPDRDIVLDKISFHYPDSDKLVIDVVNLKICDGESIAFKGSSGAGKTTLADIILGILEPISGQVLYGGIDIQELGSEWHEHLGYIPQTIYVLDDTVRTNVSFGDSNPDDEKIWKALEAAQLKDFIKSQPEGLDLRLGELGVRLSGGQRQRIGIARALYNDPDILVLDEATSALDNETEEAVMDAINYLKGTKTLIIIAHRLSTIEKCDSIYRVENGKLYKER